MNIYLDGKNEQIMDELYVVLSSDKNGEGIVSMINPPIGAMPMVFGHKRMIELTRDAIEKISKESGKKLIIVKYTQREILETVDFSN